MSEQAIKEETKTTPFKSVSEQLSNLSDKELRELEEKISVIKSLKQPNNENDGELEQFHLRLMHKLQATSGCPKAPFNTIKKTPYYKKLILAHEFVIKFLDVLVKPKKATKSNKESIFVVYANLMYEYQQKIPNYPVSLNTLVNTYDKFPDLVNRSYPGYVCNGWGAYIFSARQNPNDLKI